jgi:hypothetical protein
MSDESAQGWRARLDAFRAELSAKQRELLQYRFGEHDVPYDVAMLDAFHTSVDEIRYLAPRMSDAGLAWAIGHETRRTALDLLRREARKRRLSIAAAGR